MFSKSLHLFKTFFHLEWLEWKVKKKSWYAIQGDRCFPNADSRSCNNRFAVNVCSSVKWFPFQTVRPSYACMWLGTGSVCLISPVAWVECKYFTTINESILMQGHLNLHLLLLALIWIFHGFRYVKQCLNYGALSHFIFYFCQLIRENGQGDQVQVFVICSYIEVFAV